MVPTDGLMNAIASMVIGRLQEVEIVSQLFCLLGVNCKKYI